MRKEPRSIEAHRASDPAVRAAHSGRSAWFRRGRNRVSPPERMVSRVTLVTPLSPCMRACTQVRACAPARVRTGGGWA
jgi:hypothetical protein